MKTTFKTVITILLFIVAIFIQLFVFNNITIFGVKPNLILITMVIVGMYTNIYAVACYSFFIGYVCDLLFGTSGFCTIVYSMVGVLIGYISDNYMKENVFSAIILTAGSVTIFEIIEYIKTMAISSKYIGVMHLVGDLIISVLLNIAIASILAFVFGKINALVDKKQDNIYW